MIRLPHKGSLDANSLMSREVDVCNVAISIGRKDLQ